MFLYNFLWLQADNIAGLHANTHIPLVCGVQNRYELTGDEQSMVIQLLRHTNLII